MNFVFDFFLNTRVRYGNDVLQIKMADVYARDAAARGLRLLDSLIREVRYGAFSSQTSRAGRLDGAKRQKVDEVLDAS